MQGGDEGLRDNCLCVYIGDSLCSSLLHYSQNGKVMLSVPIGLRYPESN